MLTNPVYAGSYAYGRRGTRVTIEGGRKRIMRDTLRRDWKEWEVLIHDHHESYIIPTAPSDDRFLRQNRQE